MKKYVIKYGVIVGGINALGIISMIFFGDNANFEYAEIVGYSLMLVAFSIVYLGAKSYRDEALGGSITFGKGLLTGLLMALVASIVYVLTWLVVYYGFIPDFMDTYASNCIKKMNGNGSSEIEIANKIKELDYMKELYKNPLFVILLTFGEILPIGILAALIVSLIVRRKPSQN